MNMNDIVVKNTNLVLPDITTGGQSESLKKQKNQQQVTKKLLNVFNSLDNEINLDAD